MKAIGIRIIDLKKLKIKGFHTETPIILSKRYGYRFVFYSSNPIKQRYRGRWGVKPYHIRRIYIKE